MLFQKNVLLSGGKLFFASFDTGGGGRRFEGLVLKMSKKCYYF